VAEHRRAYGSISHFTWEHTETSRQQSSASSGLRKFVPTPGYPQGTPLLVHADSPSARLAVLNPLPTARTRHIDIRYKWINQEVEKGHILLEFVGTAAIKADGLTKALSRVKHSVFVRQLGLASHDQIGRDPHGKGKR